MGYFVTKSKDQDLGCHAHATATHRAVNSCNHYHTTYNISNGRANDCADGRAQCDTDSFTNATAPTAIASLATTRLAAGHDPNHTCSDTITHACYARCCTAVARACEFQLETK